jgi:hypothetical protein
MCDSVQTMKSVSAIFKSWLPAAGTEPTSYCSYDETTVVPRATKRRVSAGIGNKNRLTQ